MTTTMSDMLPILMSTPMVLALERKTQTRRMSRLDVFGPEASVMSYEARGRNFIVHLATRSGVVEVKSPYGGPGARLYVREGTRRSIMCATSMGVYIADDAPIAGLGSWVGRETRPGIHMPFGWHRWELDVSQVRVERLQAISEADAIAEGLKRTPDGLWLFKEGATPVADPVAAYRGGWEFLNGPESWERNPLIWVVSFRARRIR